MSRIVNQLKINAIFSQGLYYFKEWWRDGTGKKSFLLFEFNISDLCFGSWGMFFYPGGRVANGLATGKP